MEFSIEYYSPVKNKVVNEESIYVKAAKAIEEFTKDYNKVLFVVNDDQRPTPTAKVLEKLGKNVLLKSKFLIATGAHKKPDEDGLRFIFGGVLDAIRGKILIHDAVKSKHEHLGDTSRGTPVEVQKEYLEHPCRVIVTSVEPHYFAGFTGGRKSILPGLSSYDSIEVNHKMALEAEAAPSKLEGNPVHEDMVEAYKITGGEDTLCVNIVIDGDHRGFAEFHGEVLESFYKAVEAARRVYEVKVNGKADIVITEARGPLGDTLYQALKAVEHAKLAVKDGGVIILVADCRKGVGSESFYKALEDKDPEEVLSEARERFRLGYHKAARFARILLENNVYAVTELESKILLKIGVKPFRSLDEALKNAYKCVGDSPRIIYLRDGAVMIPKP